MRNVRAELEKQLRGTIDDVEWADLVKRRFDAEVLDGSTTIAELAEEVRDLRRVWGRGRARELESFDLFVEPLGAVNARIDALSAIYAHWAREHHDVRWFRQNDLVERDGPQFEAFLNQTGPWPEYRLLAPHEVASWVLARHNAAAQDGDGDAHVRMLISKTKPDGPRKVKNLWYIADRQEHVLTVGARSTLGKLANLADTLAETYRWWPSEAATFVLTDRTPDVRVYTGSAPIRYGETAVSTRVTMILDPFLTPEQVAGIYARLRAQISPTPAARSLSAKHYRLAEHIGPRVRFYLDQPAHVSRPGRRPHAGPSGLAQFIEPVGHSWQSLCREWNEKYGEIRSANGSTWRYGAVRNFNRDAKGALVRLLNPGWHRPDAAALEPTQL